MRCFFFLVRGLYVLYVGIFSCSRVTFNPPLHLTVTYNKAIHAHESKKAAREKAKAVVVQLREMKLKEAAKIRALPCLLAFMLCMTVFSPPPLLTAATTTTMGCPSILLRAANRSARNRRFTPVTYSMTRTPTSSLSPFRTGTATPAACVM